MKDIRTKIIQFLNRSKIKIKNIKKICSILKQINNY